MGANTQSDSKRDNSRLLPKLRRNHKSLKPLKPCNVAGKDVRLTV